jgi:hypothetical protein
MPATRPEGKEFCNLYGKRSILQAKNVLTVRSKCQLQDQKERNFLIYMENGQHNRQKMYWLLEVNVSYETRRKGISSEREKGKKWVSDHNWDPMWTVGEEKAPVSIIMSLRTQVRL